MLPFIIGACVGATLGVIIMCLMFTAKAADEHLGIDDK